MTKILILITLAAALAAQKPSPAQSALKAAIDKEVADGDIKAAIALYNKVANTYKADKSVAAQALLRLGQCHEKLGAAEAASAYDRLIKQYGDQKEAASARVRLAALNNAPAAMSAQLLARHSSGRFGASRIASGGRTIPFKGVDGDIYVFDLQSGDSRRVGNPDGGDPSAEGFFPVPSRDGSRIAYVWSASIARHELRIASVAGSGAPTVLLKFGSSLSMFPMDWSPDGKHLLVWAFSATASMGNMAIVNVDTAEVRPLSSPLIAYCERGNYSADGLQIVASCRKDEKSNRNIFVTDVASGKETAIVTGLGDDRHPLWLPATGQIAFISDRQGKNGLWRVEYRNGSAASPVLMQADFGNAVLLGLAPDGALIYSRQTAIQDVYLANLDPRSLRLQGAPVRFVESYLGLNAAPSWSPSGNSFAYTSMRDVNFTRSLVIRNSNQPEVLSSDPIKIGQIQPHWCGDSQLLSWGTPTPTIRRLYNATTGVASQADVRIGEELLNFPNPYQLAYSPDCHAVYVSIHAGQRRIFRIDLDTNKKTDLLTDDAEWLINPTVSPDGRWLALYGRVNKNGDPGLILIPTAGGEPRLLAPNAQSHGFSWTPDSKRVLFVRIAQGQREISSVAITGGTLQPTGIRMLNVSNPSLHPDGKRLLFDGTDATTEIWSLRNLPR